MSAILGTELWDKPDALIIFNENNNLILDKFQKFTGDFCKNQLVNTSTQRRLFERYLIENEAYKKSEYTYSKNIFSLTENICSMLNAQETFMNGFLNEIDEVIKTNSTNIKRDSRLMKADKKILFDVLARENQKLDLDFKKYRTRHSAKEAAHTSFLKAESNKALSRNQVDSYHSLYTQRKTQYEEAKSEYIVTLDNFNKYQAKHHASLLGEWGSRVQKIESERYDSLKATFANLSKLCRSMACKFNEIADEIESGIETIDCEKDCSTLVNQEKTGDVPPLDVPFKDFDVQEKVEVTAIESRSSKISNSGSDSASSNNGNRKNSLTDMIKSTRSLSRSFTGANNKENGVIANGTSTSGGGIFGKLFGGIKKTKEVTDQSIQSEIEHLESLLEEKCSRVGDTENSDEFNREIEDIKKNIESLKNGGSDLKKPESRRKTSLFQSIRHNSRNKSIDANCDTAKDTANFTRENRQSINSQSDKRRSRSLSSSMPQNTGQIIDGQCCDNKSEVIADCKPSTPLKPSKPTKPILSQKPNLRCKPVLGNNKERSGCNILQPKTIEVEYAIGHIEIVSTPQEALAIASNQNSELPLDNECYADINCEVTSAVEIIESKEQEASYNYYYVGSCVALHEYKSTDPSTMYLSFDIGDQFYIVKESDNHENSGWLLVEKIDRSQSGYVPTSYMDTRYFDAPVMMYSDHPVLMA